MLFSLMLDWWVCGRGSALLAEQVLVDVAASELPHGGLRTPA
jgi:hypothetical protein